MKYIIASDFDGTLCQNGTVSEKTVEAINKFRKKGNYFAVVTGRDYVRSFDFFKQKFSFSFDYVIACNGSCAYDKDGNICFVNTVTQKEKYNGESLAKALIKSLIELTGKPCGISFEKSRYDFHPDYPSGAKIDNVEFMPLDILDDVYEFVLANAACNSYEATAEVVGILKDKFKNFVNPLQNGWCIDISPAGIDKSTGIAQLADFLNVDYENIWTAGDNFNDIPMLKAFHGCAIESGVNEIRAVSEYVLTDVADVIGIVLKE